jgi:hemin uptake protein HemP
MPTFDSAALLDSKGRCAIVHRGRIYLLRETSNGKLILTA